MAIRNEIRWLDDWKTNTYATMPKPAKKREIKQVVDEVITSDEEELESVDDFSEQDSESSDDIDVERKRRRY